MMHLSQSNARYKIDLSVGRGALDKAMAIGHRPKAIEPLYAITLIIKHGVNAQREVIKLLKYLIIMTAWLLIITFVLLRVLKCK